jgi:hypothetical protein
VTTEQPKATNSLRMAANAASGGQRGTPAQRKLAALGFDPMQSIVDSYKAVEAEIAYQMRVRSGEIVLLNASGNPRAAYNDELIANLVEKKISIADKLMRYGYGRVPETNFTGGVDKAPLVINLRNGAKKVVNQGTEDEGDG